MSPSDRLDSQCSGRSKKFRLAGHLFWNIAWFYLYFTLLKQFLAPRLYGKGGASEVYNVAAFLLRSLRNNVLYQTCLVDQTARAWVRLYPRPSELLCNVQDRLETKKGIGPRKVNALPVGTLLANMLVVSVCCRYARTSLSGLP